MLPLIRSVRVRFVDALHRKDNTPALVEIKEKLALRQCEMDPSNNSDALVVWKLDRLGRSLRDLIIMLDDLKNRSVKFRSLSAYRHRDAGGPRHVADDWRPR
jgi:DNA invertase Pin-like site-specific DNA recombinase